PQPITVQPDIMKMECSTGQKGYFVVFGTGRYIGDDDPSDTDQQTFYGIWDWQDEFIDPEPDAFPAPQTSVSKSAYLGTFVLDDDEDITTPAPELSNAPSDADSLTLVEQEIEQTIDGYRIMSDQFEDGMPWFSSPDGDEDNDTDYVGWHFNLPDVGARVIQDPLLRPGTGGDLGIVTFVSNIPATSDCGGSAGYSWLYQASTCNGGMTSDPQFDTNNDKYVDPDDMLDDDENDTDPPDKSPTGRKFDDMLYQPIQVGSNLYINVSSDPPSQIKIPDTMEGMFYWMQH
ncbi:PilC/PilY family type IV pilus protein, partial [Desulfobacter sp.]